MKHSYYWLISVQAHKTHDNAIEDVTEVNKDTKEEMMVGVVNVTLAVFHLSLSVC